MSFRKSYITDRQKLYLKLLLNEAFSRNCNLGAGLDPHHLSDMRFEDASFAIDRILKTKANGWKPLIENDDFWFWRGSPSWVKAGRK